MSYRRHGRYAPRSRDGNQDDYYEESVASQTIVPGDSPFAYVTDGSPRLTYEELCRQAANIEAHEKHEDLGEPKKNLYPTAGDGEHGRPNYFHPRYPESCPQSSRGDVTVTPSGRHTAVRPLSSQGTLLPDRNNTRRGGSDDYDGDSVRSGQLLEQRSKDYRERDPGRGTSVRGPTSSRHPFNRLPSKDDEFGPGGVVYKPPPLPYKSQPGLPNRGEWPELVDVG
jgi:hypothetical protein